MKYPIKYIILINFFLKKRDVARGGVDGDFTSFYFSEKELRSEGLIIEETVKMMGVMKEEIVRIADDDGDKYQTKVLGNFIKTGNKIKIIDCTTDKLDKYKSRIIKKLAKSVIELKDSNKKIRYGNGEWIPFFNTGRWISFRCLYKNFPNIVTYETMGWELDRFEAIKPPKKGFSSDECKKTVQNIINGLQKKLKKSYFPKDIIEVEDGKGYRLIT